MPGTEEGDRETGPAGQAWAGPRSKSPPESAFPASTPSLPRPFDAVGVPDTLYQNPLACLLERGVLDLPECLLKSAYRSAPQAGGPGTTPRHIPVEAAPRQCPCSTATASLETAGPGGTLTFHPGENRGAETPRWLGTFSFSHVLPHDLYSCSLGFSFFNGCLPP